MKMEAYKVVRHLDNGSRVSSFTDGAFCKTYSTYLSTDFDVCLGFAFSKLETAKEYTYILQQRRDSYGVLVEYEIWEAEVDAEYVLQEMAITNSTSEDEDAIQSFWDDVIGNYDKQPAPPNTLACKSIKLMRRIL